jgi:hypothetical protein
MKTLVTTNNGGFPFELNDIRFLQDATADCLKAITQIIGGETNKSYIISGVNLGFDGSNEYSTEPGYISLKGEICRVDSSVINVPTGQIPYWGYLDEFDVAGSKTFQNGSTFDTYKERKAQLLYDTMPPVGYVPINLPSAMEIINMQTVNSDANLTGNNWTNLTINTQWNAVEALAYRKNKLGYIELKGVVKSVTILTPSGYVIATLPPEYCPIRDYFFSANRQSAASNNSITNGYAEQSLFKIDTSGNINWVNGSNFQRLLVVGDPYDFGFQIIPPH